MKKQKTKQINWLDVLLCVCTGGWYIFVIMARVNRWAEKVQEALVNTKNKAGNAAADVCSKAGKVCEKAGNVIRSKVTSK